MVYGCTVHRGVFCRGNALGHYQPHARDTAAYDARMQNIRNAYIHNTQCYLCCKDTST